MFGPHTPATILVFAASVLLLIVSFSTPFLHSVYFLSIDISSSALASGVSGVINLGLFGYCVQVNSQVSCSSPRYGYSLDLTSVGSLLSNLNLDSSGWVIKALTYPLILHPIASGLGFLSVISGLVSHFREFSRSRTSTWLASIASIVALFSFVYDILVFSLAKNRITKASTSNVTLTAQLGNAIWITLAGWASLVLSGCFFCASRRILTRRQRAQSQAHLIRPELDQDYNKHMREQAEKAEQAREQGFTPNQNQSNLPAFAEYADQDARNQEHIPLNSFQPDDEMYTHHSIAPEPYDSEAVAGVGAGYGRRQRPGLAHHSSVMSEATMYSHASQSQLPPMPPMLQPIQSYQNQSSSPLNHGSLSPPSNHNQSSDLYRSLPAHVTPASNSMNYPHHSNSLNYPYDSNSQNQPPYPNSQNQPPYPDSLNQQPLNPISTNQPPHSDFMDQPPHPNSMHDNSIRRFPQSLIPAGTPIIGGVRVHESDQTRPVRGSYASPPSQTTAMPSAQMYRPLQTVDPSLSSSQPGMPGLAYLTPHPQSDLATDHHVNTMKPEQLDDPSSTNLSGGLPPMYQNDWNQVDSNNSQVLNSTGSTEARNDGIVPHFNASSQFAPQSSRHNDPFTQTYDLGSQTRDPHLSLETTTGLDHDQSHDGSHLYSPEQYDLQSGGLTDYTASTEQPHSQGRNNSRQLPQVPSLSPLSFISPSSSPLHPRNNFDFSGAATVAPFEPTNDSHTFPSV